MWNILTSKIPKAVVKIPLKIKWEKLKTTKQKVNQKRMEQFPTQSFCSVQSTGKWNDRINGKTEPEISKTEMQFVFQPIHPLVYNSFVKKFQASNNNFPWVYFRSTSNSPATKQYFCHNEICLITGNQEMVGRVENSGSHTG